MFKNHSYNLYSETECIGQLLDEETHHIIYDRYKFASKIIGNKDVLEIGCGSGIGLNYLSKYCKNLSALEYSVENFNKLKKEFKDFNISRGDAHSTSFSSNSFDVIICLAMIYYLNIEKFLIECNRILKENGKLVFCTSNKDVPGFCPAPYTTTYYSIPELNKILVSSGYKVSFYGVFPMASYVGNLKIRSIIKNFFKGVFYKIPYGDNFWKLIRLFSRGRRIKLSKDLLFSNLKTQVHNQLLPNEINNIYRVIYVVAEK